MNIKAKQIFFVGAFIVLTIIGYKILPRDEIVIDLNSDGEISNNDKLYDSSQISTSGSSKDIIYVHIEGAVNSPGIKGIPRGTRLFELIEIANGELEEADLSKVNLASVLKDEQKVYVPYEVVENAEKVSASDLNTQSIKGNNASKNTSSDAIINNIFNNGYANELVNINIASSEELQQLEGIGPSMAKKIIDYREENGYFSDIEELKNVSGIGEAKYNKIKDRITI